MIARAALVGLLLCVGAREVRADARADAKLHYALAIDLIKTGQHREAIAEFDLAYQSAPLPNILFNQAQEYRALLATDEPLERLQDLNAAMVHYRRYLDARKDAPDLIDVEKAISELQAALPGAQRGAAKHHYSRAVELIKNDQHREAIAEFQRAYELASLPNILFNIAREFHALGDSGGEAAMSEVPDMEQAVQYYQRYLAGQKGSPDRLEVERAVAALQQRIESARHPLPPEARRPVIATPRPVVAPVRAFDANANANANEETAPSVRRGRRLTVAGVALLAAGALIAAGGAVGLAVDRRNPGDQSDFTFSFGGGTGITNAASPLQPLYIAGIAAGGVVAIAGAVLIALGTRREKEHPRASLEVAPLVGNGFAGALLGGSF